MSNAAALRLAPEPMSSIATVPDLAGFAQLFEPTVNAVIHPRALPRELTAEAAAFAGSRKLVVAAAANEAELASELGLGPALASDVARWVELMVDLTDARLVGVRFAFVTAAMCPRFHVDHVTVRIVTTYVGPGTELVAADDVDPERLSPRHGGLPDESSGLLRRSDAIRRASAGDVVALKGALWPADVGPIVHRSPACSEPRLVLTLDALGPVDARGAG